MGAIIKLTYAQISMAAYVGVMRRTSNLKRGVAPKYGATNGPGSWDLEVISCCAELAVAKYLNLFWCGSIGDFAAKDVGRLVQVRSTDKPTHRLILHPRDDDRDPFVLAIMIGADTFDLCGWIFAREGKCDAFWCDPSGTGRPAFFVPNEKLRPMAQLLDGTIGPEPASRNGFP
jgi:hypothetical protein